MFFFLKACPKLDHMTHAGLLDNCFKSLKVAQKYFLQKLQTKDAVQMARVLAFNESANTKIALCTHLRLNLNGNHVVRIVREYSIARSFRPSSQSRCWRNNEVQITRFAETIVINDDRTT